MKNGRTSIYNLGIDKCGKQWSVEVNQPVPSDTFFDIYVWPANYKRNDEADPHALSYLSINSEAVGKIETIEVIYTVDNQGIGSLLLAFIERFACDYGAIRLYGDLSRRHKDHFDKLEHFYKKQGWTWEIFEENDLRRQKDSYILGRVEKQIQRVQNDNRG